MLILNVCGTLRGSLAMILIGEQVPCMEDKTDVSLLTEETEFRLSDEIESKSAEFMENNFVSKIWGFGFLMK